MTDIILGRDIINGRNVKLEHEDRHAGMLVIGKTGSGKSTFLEQMCIQDITSGAGCCVIEPAGSLINRILPRIPQERRKDVILLFPEDEQAFGLNIYECPDPTSPRMVAYTLNNIMDTFEKLYDMSRATPRMAQVMRNIALTMIHNQGMTLLDVPLLLSDDRFRTSLIANAPPNVRLFWTRYNRMRPSEQWDLTESTQNKIDEFVNDPLLWPIFGQSHTTINFREVMDQGKIVFVHLSNELPVMTNTLGCIIVGQLLIAALSRDPMQKNKQFPLYIDEFQRFLTPSLNTLLTEARKYSIATCVAHQVRDQLGDVQKATTLQARSIICFSVTGHDAEELAREYDTTPPQQLVPAVTPANILDYLKDHQSREVQDLWTYYVSDWQQAARKEAHVHYQQKYNMWRNRYGVRIDMDQAVYKHEVEGATPIEEEVWTFPEYDFRTGTGLVSYNPENIHTALFELQHLLLYCMRAAEIEYGQIHHTFPNNKDLDFSFDTLPWGTPGLRRLLKALAPCYNFAIWFYWMYAIYDAAVEKPMTLEEVRAWIATAIPPSDRREMKYFEHINANVFLEVLSAAVKALRQHPIEIPALKIIPPQQTYADKEKQIANELKLLTVGQARVRVPAGETTIAVLLPTTPKSQRNTWREIRQQVLEQTRRLYCKTHAEVEEEIRARQAAPGDAPSRRRGEI